MSTGLCPVGPHIRINGRPCQSLCWRTSRNTSAAFAAATRRGPGWGRPPARRLECAPGLHLGGQWEAWRRVGVVHDADRPARADNCHVASYSMHIDIDLRIDGNWITRVLRSA
jgi:hypothetical protein